MSTQAGNTCVTAVLVPENERMAFLPQYLGRHLMRGEATVYSWAATLSVDYQGGLWSFYRLSNGGFYMAPTGRERLNVQCDGNGFNREMSADAMGIVVTLFALGHLAEVVGDESFVEYYHALRAFALDHSESNLIFQAID